MVIEARDYQARTVKQVHAHWDGGAFSVLVAAPPGSGKTEIAVLTRAAFELPMRTLWVVPTRYLAEQAIARLGRVFGSENITALMGGRVNSSGAPITVATIQSLMRGAELKDVDLVVVDEAHHFVAAAWRELSRKIHPRDGRRLLWLGLTATPERDDGTPLGDMFERLVVAAKYSELIAAGHLMRPVVVAPPQYLKGDWAQNPVDAWAQYSSGGPTIAFFPDTQTADLYTLEFRARGVRAAAAHVNMSESDRIVARTNFEEGKLDVLVTVASAIEGIDIPRCSVALLCRPFRSTAAYLQATGRPIRVHPGKSAAVIIDLPGASRLHGHPTNDPDYSLDGGVVGTGSPRESDGPIPCSPSVLDIDMMASDDSYVPAPLPLPPPDMERVKHEDEERRRRRELQTRYGKDVAQSLIASSAGGAL